MRPPLPALLLTALAAACGHRADPLPPLRRTPPPPQGFRLAQRGEALEVRATAPAASVDGVPYATLVVEFLHATGPVDIEKAGGARAVPAPGGGRVVETLPLPPPGTTVRAAARAVVGRERGPRTLTQGLVTVLPPEAPRELDASLAGEGVRLAWRGARPREEPPPTLQPGPAGPPFVAPAAGAPSAEPPASKGAPPDPGEASGGSSTEGGAAVALRRGFLVYRRLGGAPYGEPLVGEPQERRSFEDAGAPRGATACYVVRAAASLEPLVESAPSNEACVDVRDVVAPAPPAGLAVLPRERGLEVLWSPSAEPDVAGYRVYRTAPGGQRERVAEVGPSRAAWLDEAVGRGVTYAYSVGAFDEAGNESEPTEPVEASFP
jgi:hypothetical protein